MPQVTVDTIHDDEIYHTKSVITIITKCLTTPHNDYNLYTP